MNVTTSKSLFSFVYYQYHFPQEISSTLRHLSGLFANLSDENAALLRSNKKLVRKVKQLKHDLDFERKMNVPGRGGSVSQNPEGYV